MNIEKYLGSKRKLIDRYLLKYLPAGDRYTSVLARAMKYSVIAKAKRIRPILLLAACEAVGSNQMYAMPASCAIEMIHTYTLIHDDLPAMDNDDWRRGKPSSHKMFGEDIAILTGDALSMLAFKLIAEKTDKRLKRETVLRVIAEISKALMDVVRGQVADLRYEGNKYKEKDLEFIHFNKTASLIKASVRCGALIGGAGDELVNKLGNYGENLGLAFQITDDILDVVSTREKLGKTPKKDIIQKKATYPGLVGLERSKQIANNKLNASIKALQGLDKRFNILRQIANYLGGRQF